MADLIFNTITNLTTQDEQVECFRNVAAHIEPGGFFIIEVGEPDFRRPGETTRVFATSRSYIGFVGYTDMTAQVLLCSERMGGRPLAGLWFARSPDSWRSGLRPWPGQKTV